MDNDSPAVTPRYLKIIACEIALREICHAASRSINTLDLDFLTQGLHDHPVIGRQRLQEFVDAQPSDKYDALLIGYGLCGNIVQGLRARHTPLVLPRAHDCITFFLGSRARYGALAQDTPSAYFYSSGWLECLKRRGGSVPPAHPALLPVRAGDAHSLGNSTYQQWIEKYGEENARHLLEIMNSWTDHYTHGVLIDFDFAHPLDLPEKVRALCRQNGWQFQVVEGDLSLLQRWVDARWDPEDFLIVPPRHRVIPSYRDSIIEAVPDSEDAPAPECNVVPA